ncbi:MAG: nuclease subunit of the excinuclease complex [Pseudonocardiales bacterium]|jgi:hypothetical protein|nr:nuclease subunit of the excinuclease complex [Pseudonocardiales bacterium]
MRMLGPVVITTRRSARADGDGVRHSWPVAAVDDDLVGGLAVWSPWLPFGEAVAGAPRLPGVYLARQGSAGGLVYVGMAGERRGQGIRGRLTVYRRGKGAVSGLGEAVLDRALADPNFVRQRLDELAGGKPKRAAVWAQDAFAWADLHVRWTVADDRAAAARAGTGSARRVADDAVVESGTMICLRPAPDCRRPQCRRCVHWRLGGQTLPPRRSKSESVS